MRCEPTKTKLNFLDSLTQISTISHRRLTADLNLQYGMLCTALFEFQLVKGDDGVTMVRFQPC